MGMPEDIANAALFLASDESAFVNGAVITCDRQHIQAAKFLHRQVDHLHAGLRVTHVALTGDHFTRSVLQGLRQLLEAVQPPGHGDDIGALPGKPLYDGPAHTGGCAGHYNRLILKTGPIYAMRKAVQTFIAQGEERGNIINITSVAIWQQPAPCRKTRLRQRHSSHGIQIDSAYP